MKTGDKNGRNDNTKEKNKSLANHIIAAHEIPRNLHLTFFPHQRAQQIEGQITRFIFFSSYHLEFVIVVLNTRNLDLDTLAFPHVLDDLTGLGGRVEDGTTRKNGPMVEHRLGECLPTGVRAEIGGETERLVDGQESLDIEQRSTRTLLLRENVASPSCQDTVNTTHSLFRNLDLDEIDGL